MSRHGLFSFGAYLAGLALACGTSSSTPSSTPDAACDRYFNAIFGKVAACEGNTAYTGDELATFRVLCEHAINAPGSGITPAWLDSCSAAVAGFMCGSGLDPLDNSPCTTPTGTLTDGAACGSDTQCRAVSFCKKGQTTTALDGGTLTTTNPCGQCAARVPDGSACVTANGDQCMIGSGCSNGTCTPSMTSDVGGPCTGGSSCKRGLACDFVAGKCIALAAAGAACQTSSQCQLGLVCVKGTCGQPVAQGGACAVSSDCAQALGCDAVAKTCQPLRYEKPGGPCDGQVGKCEIRSCKVPPGSTMGTCPPVLAVGAACGASVMGVCDDLAECTNGTCQLADPGACH
jgi:hypothetical protein